MFKRSKGYFLLTMLVLTGFAGRIQSDTLSGKERRTLLKELKTSKTGLAESIAGLNSQQLNFKPAKGQLSIKECIYKLAAAENELWITANLALQRKADIKKTILQDEALTAAISSDKLSKIKEPNFRSIKEAMKLYRKNRNQMQKFVNTSTENARRHIAPTSFGNFDVYQILLLNTIISNEYMEEIEKI